MRFRRPNILLFNAWMGECETMLIKSPKTEDKRLIAWLHLQRIADEAYTAFGFDDASTSFELSALRLQAILKIFERRMQEWRKAVPDEVMTSKLVFHFQRCKYLIKYSGSFDGISSEHDVDVGIRHGWWQ